MSKNPDLKINQCSSAQIHTKFGSVYGEKYSLLLQDYPLEQVLYCAHRAGMTHQMSGDVLLTELMRLNAFKESRIQAHNDEVKEQKDSIALLNKHGLKKYVQKLIKFRWILRSQWNLLIACPDEVKRIGFTEAHLCIFVALASNKCAECLITNWKSYRIFYIMILTI